MQRHRAIVRLTTRALREDHGGEVLEYSLVTGLIVVAAIGVISCVGSKLVTRWNSINTKL